MRLYSSWSLVCLATNGGSVLPSLQEGKEIVEGMSKEGLGAEAGHQENRHMGSEGGGKKIALCRINSI